MSTRYDKQGQSKDAIAAGYEGLDSGDIYVPPCTIEDVDRSVFNLFENQIPLQYMHKKKKKKRRGLFAPEKGGGSVSLLAGDLRREEWR